MDYEKMKNMAVEKCWKGVKSGDKYRSLRIQLDHFEEHIKEKNSPLQWLPLEEMTEDELSDIAVNFYNRQKENRLLFNKLKYKGIKYDYSDLLIESAKRKKEFEEIIRTLPELETYSTIRISDYIDCINIDLEGANYEGYQVTANKMLRYDDMICNQILNEKQLFECIGIGFTNTQYIEQYINACERICFGILFYFVLENKNVIDKDKAFEIVKDNVSKIEVIIKDELKESKNNYLRRINLYEKYDGESMNNADDIMMYYVQFLNRNAYYNEWEKITEAVQSNDIDDIQQRYQCLKDNKQKIDEYILEGKTISEYLRKKDECKKLLIRAREMGNYWASFDDIEAVKIIIREGFIDKTAYNRRTAMSIIRNFIENQELSVSELMFLDMKMLRGVFRERGYLPYFDIFRKICSDLRSLYLLSYSTLNDVEAYKLVHRICFDFLYVFGDTEYSNLTFE